MDPTSQAVEPPAKRQRISPSENTVVSGKADVPSKEQKSGITAFINPHLPGFSGVLKHRYTDFLVNEILPDGQVLHLQSIVAPKQSRPEVKRDHVPQANGKENAAANGDENHTTKNPSADVDKLKSEDANDSTTTVPITKTDDSEVKEPDESLRNMVKQERDDEKASVSSLITDQHLATLEDLLGKSVTNKIITLYGQRLKDPARKPRDFQPIKSDVIGDKDRRTSVHKAVRDTFNSKLETVTGDDDTISFTVASAAVQSRGAWGRNTTNSGTSNRSKPLSWEELGGDYLHFTLYKENRDTMESVSFLARELKVQPKSFQFSGTKDRRAVTVQRVSAYRLRAGDMAALNRKLYGSKLGDFQHSRYGLELGELGGNEFVITLRDCHFPGEENLALDARLELAQKTVSDSVEAFKTGGFLNYYGLQRFGSFNTSTDEVGLKLLQGNLQGAVSDILSFSPVALAAAQNPEENTNVSKDDIARAQAINIWLSTHNAPKALEVLPRKFSAEMNIIRHLGARKNSQNDYQGALSSITRNLRLMYVHAYQSLVWNIIAGKRWELHRHNVVEGDLVLVSEHKDKESDAAEPTPTHDEKGEPIVQPAPQDRATRPEDDYEQARALTAEEVASGLYNVFDIVLPLPGYDVIYPPNALGEEYKNFMSSEMGGGLDPYDMRRSWRDMSLSGGYRKVLAKPGSDMLFDIKTYERIEEQLVETDLQRLEKEKEKGRQNVGKDGAASINGHGHGHGNGRYGAHAQQEMEGVATAEPKTMEKKIAVVLKFKLGPSQYATMALRELMKEGGCITYKADFGGGR